MPRRMSWYEAPVCPQAPQNCREELREPGGSWGAGLPVATHGPPLPKGAGAGLLADEVGLSHTSRVGTPLRWIFRSPGERVS